MKIPKPIINRISSLPPTIGALVLGDEEQRSGESFPCNGTKFFGFQLPTYQRPLVWTTEQSTRFIESAYMGFDLGTYVVNMMAERSSDLAVIAQYDGLLIDGQQRINSIRAYVHNEFPVYGYLWKDIDSEDQIRFRRTLFARGEISLTDDAVLRDLYNRLNFGGTPHTAEQRA